MDKLSGFTPAQFLCRDRWHQLKKTTMKKIIGLLFTGLFLNFGFAQNFQDDFQKFIQSNDTINQRATLIEWEKHSPNNPELFTSYFNYHFLKSKQEILSLSTIEPKGEKLIIRDSLNQIAGFLGSQSHYNQAEFLKGINKINKGIELFPNRLDMRFGKIYAYGQIEDWENFTNEIIKTVRHSTLNNNNWEWTNGEKVKAGGEDYFLSALQDYQRQLYDTENDDLLVNMRNIANEILSHYPNHIESLSNLSITYLLEKEYDKAIEALLKAERIDPEDYIVLANIAQGYKLKGDIKKSIEYYKKTARFSQGQTKEYAKQQIEILRKK